MRKIINIISILSFALLLYARYHQSLPNLYSAYLFFNFALISFIISNVRFKDEDEA